MDDYDRLATLQRDPVVMRFILGGARTPEQTRAELQDYVASWRDERYGMWAVFDRSDDAFLGIVGLVWRDDMGMVTLRVALGKESQGRGLGGEAIQAAIDWSFNSLGLQHLVGIVQSANDACRKMVNRLGLTLEKAWKRGEAMVEQYGMSFADWQATCAQRSTPRTDRAARPAAIPAFAASTLEPLAA
ncbi:MAG: GNAT family N-acetyltransferase [Acetobacteraceae bacterium]|nr:GNAT family N-acetyltransferase [Acetobacteraceae bacterium]